MKNAFYFVFKDLFILQIFTFLSIFFGYVKKTWEKVMADFKMYDVTDWTTNDYHTIFPNISRSKENQADHKIYSMRNILLQKSYTKYGEKLVVDPFIQHISESTIWIVLNVVFVLCPIWGLPKYVKNRCWPLALTLHKMFLKNKKRTGTNLFTSFSA